MSIERLVAAFQPALLSRIPSAMSAEDHVLAAKTMVFMVENYDDIFNLYAESKTVQTKDVAERTGQESVSNSPQ